MTATLANILDTLAAANIAAGIETTPRRKFVQAYTTDDLQLVTVLKDSGLTGIRVSPQGAPAIYNIELV